MMTEEQIQRLRELKMALLVTMESPVDDVVFFQIEALAAAIKEIKKYQYVCSKAQPNLYLPDRDMTGFEVKVFGGSSFDDCVERHIGL